MSKGKKKQRKGTSASTINTGHVVAEIVRRLEMVEELSHIRREVIFKDWVLAARAALEALPYQLQAGYQGVSIEDTNARLFRTISSHYRSTFATVDNAPAVWGLYAKAFRLLLKSARRDLWLITSSPDVLGPVWRRFLQPPDVTIMSWEETIELVKHSFPDGQQLLLERVQQALSHPNNRNVLPVPQSIGGDHNILIGQLLLAVNDSYEPLNIVEPSGGTGQWTLAAARQFPAWALFGGWVLFGSAPGPDLNAAMIDLNAWLWGLNGFFYNVYKALNPEVEMFYTSIKNVIGIHERAINVYQQYRLQNRHFAGTPFEVLYD